MKPRLDPSTALAPAAARFEHQRSDARQQRWMAQLEQAMLAQAQPQPQSVRADANDAGREEARAARGQDTQAPLHAAGRPQAHVAVLAGQARVAASQARTAASSASETETRAGAARSGFGAAAGLSASERDGAMDGAGDVASAGPGMGAVAVSALQPGGLPGASSVTMTGLGAQPQSVLQAARAAMAQPETGPAPGAASAAPLTPFGAIAGAALSVAPAVDGADEGAAAGAPDMPASGEEYHKQLLHLFHGADGVHAYIRDAALDGVRLRLVAQALAAELNGSGARLAGLTVNGRRVDPDGLDGGTEYEETAPATASRRVAPQVNLKGAT